MNNKAVETWEYLGFLHKCDSLSDKLILSNLMEYTLKQLSIDLKENDIGRMDKLIINVIPMIFNKHKYLKLYSEEFQQKYVDKVIKDFRETWERERNRWREVEVIDFEAEFLHYFIEKMFGDMKNS